MSILTIERSGHIVPGVIAPLVGASDYDKAIGGITNFLNDKTTSVNHTYLSSVSSIAKVGQTWTSERHAQSVTLGAIKAPRNIVTAHYSYNDIARGVFEGNAPGVSFKNLQDALCIQGIAQKVRIGALYGFNTGEGILNSGASTFTFGSDANGKSKASEYDPAWFANKIMSMVRNLATDVLGRTDRIVILTSRRMSYLLGSTPIPLASVQRDGGGVDTITTAVERFIREGLKIECEILVDDTLENANANGDKDLFVAIAPGIASDPVVKGGEDLDAISIDVNTITYNTTMDKGSGSTIEVRNPDLNRVVSGEHYAYITPGFCTRSEAVVKSEIAF